MGVVRLFSSSRSIEETSEIIKGNPDPEDFVILKDEIAGEYMAIKLRYPNCMNFEGNKILVYKGFSPRHLNYSRFIDPHFCDLESDKTLLARFRPTEEGWQLAINLINSLALGEG